MRHNIAIPNGVQTCTAQINGRIVWIKPSFSYIWDAQAEFLENNLNLARVSAIAQNKDVCTVTQSFTVGYASYKKEKSTPELHRTFNYEHMLLAMLLTV